MAIKYRCVYCKKTFFNLKRLDQHDKECPMKAIKKAEWEGRIEKSLDAR
jgi:DNA-directed RNA polymerase subunit RPC12/RpoP